MSHATFEHPTLGTFAYEGRGHWTGRLGALELTLSGTEVSPDASGLASAEGFARRLASTALEALVERARGALRAATTIAVHPSASDPLELAWLEGRPAAPRETIALAFTDDTPGSYVVWKVVCIEGEPRQVEQTHW